LDDRRAVSANGTLAGVAWANGEHTFNIAKIGLLLDLEAKCDATIGLVYERLLSGRWGVNDVREVIRLGLIGGGMAQHVALATVQRAIDNGFPLSQHVLMAVQILAAAIVGVEGDPVGKKAAADRAEESHSITPRGD
jgi:hypothetical protein